MSSVTSSTLFKPTKKFTWKIRYSSIQQCHPGQFLRSRIFIYKRTSCEVLLHVSPSHTFRTYTLWLVVRNKCVWDDSDFTLGLTDMRCFLTAFYKSDATVSSPGIFVGPVIQDIEKYKMKFNNRKIIHVSCQMGLSRVLDIGISTTFGKTPEPSAALKEFFGEELENDMSIIVIDRLFYVNKKILINSSTVFAGILENSVESTFRTVVNINDSDPDTFESFLDNIYTGKVNISSLNMIGLFHLADCYGIQNLKDNCVQFINNNISSSNVCDILVLANRHYYAQLKARAEALILDNWQEIIFTHEWESFMEKNNSLGLELMRKAAVRLL